MNYNKTTLQTYTDNIKAYIDGTPKNVSGEHKQYIDTVLSYVSKSSKILEVWCGSWRDANYIESQGYSVERTDAAQWFIDYNISLWKKCRFLDLLDFHIDSHIYDLIFGKTVLLHFTDDQFVEIFDKLLLWLRIWWLFALTLKNGEWEEISSHKMGNPRYFNYWNKEKLQNTFKKYQLEIILLEPTKDKKRIKIILEKH